MAVTKQITLLNMAYGRSTMTGSYSYTSGNKVGYDLHYGLESYQNVMRLTPHQGGYTRQAVGQKVQFTISLSAASGNTVQLVQLERVYSGDANLWNDIASGVSLGTYTTGATHTITVTDEALATKILHYGLGVRPTSWGSWNTEVNVEGEAEVTYSDPGGAPEIAVTAPSVAYLSDPTTVTWTYSQTADVPQSKLDAELVSADGTTLTLAAEQAHTAHSYTVPLPSISFPPGSATLRLRVYSANNVASAWAELPIEIRHVAYRIVSPSSGENKLAAQPITLIWTKAEGDASQNVVPTDLDYSTNGGETWTALLTNSQTSPDEGRYSYTVPADTFPHGTVRWRVRPRSNPQMPGEYVQSAFQAVIQAATGALTCDGKPHPTLSWESQSQAAYQVQFADYDSGAVYGSATSFTVPRVYADGLYPARARTQAATGEWSAWTEWQYVQITNVPPAGSVTLTAVKSRHEVGLSWEASGEFAGYVLYRDGAAIYAGEGAVYTDREGNGQCVYTVRAVTVSGYMAESSPITVDAAPATDCVILADGEGGWLPLKYSLQTRSRQYNDTATVSYRHFAGRKYPVAFSEGFATRTGIYSYCFKTKAEADTLAGMSGREVIIKTTDNRTLRGVLADLSKTQTRQICDTSFTVTQLDQPKEADYLV